jgi:hypothetical protein
VGKTTGKGMEKEPSNIGEKEMEMENNRNTGYKAT